MVSRIKPYTWEQYQEALKGYLVLFCLGIVIMLSGAAAIWVAWYWLFGVGALFTSTALACRKYLQWRWRNG